MKGTVPIDPVALCFRSGPERHPIFPGLGRMEVPSLARGMTDRLLFIGKILLLSAFIAVFIKHVAPGLALSPDPSVALSLVLFPPLVTLLALWRRSFDP